MNRATFYAHFTDKYDILDYTLSVTILKDLNDTLNISEVINEEFCLLSRLNETVINNELEDIFTIMLENSFLVMNERYW